MFKKFKDKLTEEMKSSPNRLQQLAQAAQAAVTSASSSISDISNNDLFSIADEGSDTPQKVSKDPSTLPVGFQDVSLSHSPSPSHASKQEVGDKLTPLANSYYNSHNPKLLDGGSPPYVESARVRKLSNSSASSDVSFRFPTYESPSGMFQLQSDVEASASEMEDNVPSQLERVSKEHLYAAYRRTNEKYRKYRERCTDLMKHYHNLMRENAKAKDVLVETQDKALRRISELREQCQLEQSAKAHLENELRIELDERNIKIESLNTKIKLLQSYSSNHIDIDKETAVDSKTKEKQEANPPLIDLSSDENTSTTTNNCESHNFQSKEVTSLNSKIQKLEQLLAKCKETIKTHKEKNIQLNSELQIVSTELDKVKIENTKMESEVQNISDLRKQYEDSQNHLKSLQGELNNFEAKKATVIAGIQSELNSAKSKISSLNESIVLLKRREEENVISLAENKLTIHKELEGKENEIKKLKENITLVEQESKSKDILISDFKQQIHSFEEQKSMLNKKTNELNVLKSQQDELNQKILGLNKKKEEADSKYQSLVEKLKCTELQLKQESDEKLATIDRNNFLEDRVKQLNETNTEHEKKVADLEHQTSLHEKLKCDYEEIISKHKDLIEDHEKQSIHLRDVEEFDLELEQNLKDLQSKYSSLNNSYQELTELSKKNDLENESKINKLIATLNELENKHINSEPSIELYQEKILQLENDFKNKGDELNEVIRSKVHEYESLKKDYTELEKKLEKQANAVNSNHEEISSKCDDLLKHNNELNVHVEELTKENTRLKSDIDKCVNDKNTLEKSLLDYQQEMAESESNLNEMKGQIAELQDSLVSLQDTYNNSVIEKTNLEKKVKELQSTLSNIEKEYEHKLNSSTDEIQNLNNAINASNAEKEELIICKNNLTQQLSNIQQNLSDSDKKIRDYAESNDVWEMKLSNILDDNNSLQEKCKKLKQEKENALEQIALLESKTVELDTWKSQLEELKLEKEFLNMRVGQLDADLKQRTVDKESLSTELNSLRSKMSECNKESNSNFIENEALKEKESTLRNEMQKCIDENDSLRDKLKTEICERESISIELENCQRKQTQLESLIEEKNIFEIKYADLSKEHRNVEDALEKIKIQSEQFNDLLTIKNKEHDELSNKYSQMKSENEQLSVRIKVLEKIESDYSTEIENMQTLKEENAKHLSNIESLQSHLTKASKENSVLNDRIREYQANDEVMQVTLKKNLETSRKDGISKDANINFEISRLKEENTHLLERIRSSEEDVSNKILDLERQNSILIEEKLELEDQLKSSLAAKQITPKEEGIPSNSIELQQMKSRMNDILNEKLDLESRLANMELMNRSGDSNMRLLEQKNEKLGLANEKLERRLDEALVSLNHIRNLEENTELEYLRNILYEYLTGPTNNNLILAKVLSAVVKFDHRQTQLVLEREKERQGLLAQLGLL